jgi:hypothetical protein
MKKLSWPLTFLIIAVSCLEEPDCYQLHNDILGITFRVMGTGQGDTVYLKNFPRVGEEARLVSFDTALNYFLESGRLDFELDTASNFLTFAYNVKNQFISEECGSSFVLSDLRVLEHNFDSVRVVNSTPTKAGGTNIEIYRCPETDTLTIDFNQLFANTNGVTITNPRSSYISYDFDLITNPEDSVFSGPAATVKLPVNLLENEANFIFTTDLSADTLQVTYDRVTEERYPPCGIQTFVTGITIGEHTFDSISYALDDDDEPLRALVDPQAANLRVFDCPPTNWLQVIFVSAPNQSTTVSIKSITGDHFEGNLLTSVYSSNIFVLPVDPESTTSTFFIQYEDDSIDTLSVQYTFSSLRYFKACPNPVITGLRLVETSSSIRVLNTTLQYPAVSNVEITVD